MTETAFAAYLHEACGATRSDAAWEIERRIDQVTGDLALELDALLETVVDRGRALICEQLAEEDA